MYLDILINFSCALLRVRWSAPVAKSYTFTSRPWPLVTTRSSKQSMCTAVSSGDDCVNILALYSTGVFASRILRHPLGNLESSPAVGVVDAGDLAPSSNEYMHIMPFSEAATKRFGVRLNQQRPNTESRRPGPEEQRLLSLKQQVLSSWLNKTTSPSTVPKHSKCRCVVLGLYSNWRGENSGTSTVVRQDFCQNLTGARLFMSAHCTGTAAQSSFFTPLTMLPVSSFTCVKRGQCNSFFLLHGQ